MASSTGSGDQIGPEAIATPSDSVARAAADDWSSGLKTYVLFVLCMVGALNFIDRQVLSILVEDVKRDLSISDTQFGLLSGLAFAACYVVAGIPLARIADRGTRRTLIAGCLAFWSVATMACGLSRTYAQIVLARMGVAFGEAGAFPASQSMLADMYPLSRRSKVFATLSASQAVGIAFGLFMGGWLNEQFGWRTVFFIVGAPGVLVALLVLLTVPEPPRTVRAGGDGNATLGETVRFLFGQRSLRFIMAGFGAIGFTGYSLFAWTPAFLIRTHGLATHDVGLLMGGCVAAGLVFGSIVGGIVSDRLVARDERWALRISAICALATVPCLFLFLTAQSVAAAATFFLCYNVVAGGIQSPAFALVHSLVPHNMRATGTFLITVIQNIFGVALGPVVVGLLSDRLAPTYGDGAVGRALLVVLLGGSLASIFFLTANRWVKRDLLHAA